MDNTELPHIKRAWEFFSSFGENPLCLAPMAEVNDLPFRLICRRHGINVCYTGMLNAFQYTQSHEYKERMYNVCPEDHPLIAQIAGSNFDVVIKTAKDIAETADAIDINLGCTQRIASRGGYGFFLVNTAQKRIDVLELFRKLSHEVSVPICAKVRILITDEGQADCQGTVEFCQSLQNAGVSIIEIHGRSQHRDKHGKIDVNTIAAVVKSLKIPVIANGGVTSLDDAKSLREATGAAGIMIGQQLLSNPTTFDPKGPSPISSFAKEYIQIVKEHPVDIFSPRKHIFYFFADIIRTNPPLANELKETNTFDEIAAFIERHSH